MPVDEGHRYFTVGVAAERLGLSRPKVYRPGVRPTLRPGSGTGAP